MKGARPRGLAPFLLSDGSLCCCTPADLVARVVGCARVEEPADGCEEAARGWWWGNAAGEDCFVGEVLAAVIGLRVFSVLVDYVAGEVDAGEEALAAGVGENRCIGEFSGGGLRVATDGAG